ncbi:endonuclease [Myroides odoratimimus]|uniref:endonuclease I family protein n=1 Tax=Myroides odoratimimus TaxID=76832 RepID=UPI001CE0C741|nr:endonuclease [Myroides odoratimimus]MCA4793105.1 endonuclease [Myroides odoratimimus]MCA4806763.1 endonuclease [Myroides odoratimimus]MCA4820366.1 endonuclease [Myroides odoratimimus]MCO7723431.1 endonuclease [Myroides odoratimimus]MCS7474812.1 endonuclease [Myroides odoratimimus]
MIKRFSIVLCLAILSFSCSKEDNAIIDKPIPEDPNPPITDNNLYDSNNYIPVTKEEIAYYRDIDLNLRGLKLKESLNKLVTKTHRHLKYTPDVWNASKITDEDPDNPNNVLLIYGWPHGESNKDVHTRSLDKERRNTSGTSNPNLRDKLWEREHVYAKSLANPKLVTDKYSGYTEIGLIAGTDVHNLRPINGEWNNTRGNLKFVDGKGNSGKRGNYWFPGEEWKGDVARMMMYMFVRYEQQCHPGAIGEGSILFFNKGERDGMIDLFLKWNEEDPVSEIERRRNEYHGNPNNQYSQGNRNPFIDNPYLANLIWGNDNGKLKLSENKWAKK